MTVAMDAYTSSSPAKNLIGTYAMVFFLFSPLKVIRSELKKKLFGPDYTLIPTYSLAFQ